MEFIMNRIFTNGLLVAGLAFSLGLAGCGSDAGTDGGIGADAGTTDVGADTAATADTAGGSDSTASDTAVADTAVDPCSTCAENQECKNDICVDKVPPCGGPCAAGEICDLAADDGKGKCVKPSCALPEAKTFTDNTNINKIIKLSILKKDKGCDLDGDVVPNNVLGGLYDVYPQIDGLLSDSVKDGTIVILLSPDAFKTDGTEFTCDLLIGDVDPSTKDCDASAASGCKYTVSPVELQSALRRHRHLPGRRHVRSDDGQRRPRAQGRRRQAEL